MERLCCLHALRSYANQALGAATALGSSFAYPSLDEAFVLQPVESGVESANRARAPRRGLNFRADGGAIGLLTQARGGGQYEIFKLAQHDYFYIVMLRTATRQAEQGA